MKLLLGIFLFPALLWAQPKSVVTMAAELDALADDAWFFLPDSNGIDVFYCARCNENWKSASGNTNRTAYFDKGLANWSGSVTTVSLPPRAFDDTLSNWTPIDMGGPIQLRITFDPNFTVREADERCNQNRVLKEYIWSNKLYKVSQEEFNDFRIYVPKESVYKRLIPDSISTYLEREPYWGTQNYQGALFIDMDYDCFLCEDYLVSHKKFERDLDEAALIADDKYILFQQLMNYFGIQDATYRLSKGERLIIQQVYDAD